MSQEEKHTTTWNGLLTFLRAGDTPATTGGWKKKKRGRPSRLRGRKNNGPGPERGGPPRPCRPGCVCGCLLLQRHSGTVTNVYLGLSCHHYLLALVHLRHLSTTQCPFCVDVSAPALPLLRVSHHHCPVSGVPEAQKEFATRKKKKKKTATRRRRVAVFAARAPSKAAALPLVLLSFPVSRAFSPERQQRGEAGAHLRLLGRPLGRDARKRRGAGREHEKKEGSVSFQDLDCDVASSFLLDLFSVGLHSTQHTTHSTTLHIQCMLARCLHRR